VGIKNFSQAVYAVVRQIPKGSVLTYQEAARRAGYPKAARAVGTVLSKNKDPKIPCHRVIRSDGKRILDSIALSARCDVRCVVCKARGGDRRLVLRLRRATQQTTERTATRRDMANFYNPFVAPCRCAHALTDSSLRGLIKISQYRTKKAMLSRILGGYNGLMGSKERLLRKEGAL
jgi:O-6-methylguanine DNA methyltransferase